MAGEEDDDGENQEKICYTDKFLNDEKTHIGNSVAGAARARALVHLPSNIFLVAPKLWPACVAPLLLPACSPMTPSPARSCSSVQSRLFSSDGLGPNDGPLHSGCLCACGGGENNFF